MSAIGDCCQACPPTTPPVNIPGSPGTPGTPGTNGVNSFSTIASFQGVGFVVPAVGSSATIYVTDTGEWMSLNQPVFISGAGQYAVTATASTGVNGTSVQLKNTGQAGNAVPGSSISAGNTISPSGVQGNNAYGITTAQFSWTTFGSNSTITCTNPSAGVAWMQPNQVVFVAGAGYFQVNGAPNVVNGTASLTLLNYAGNSQNGSVSSGAGVSPAGVQGSQPLPTPQTFFSNSLTVNLTGSMVNIGSAQVTLPAAGTWLLSGRIALTYTNTSNSVQPQVSSQLEAQAAGAGPFSALPNSVTNPFLGYISGNGLVTGAVFTIPPVIYTTATIGDVIALYADYLTATTGGNITVKEATIMATCLNLTT